MSLSAVEHLSLLRETFNGFYRGKVEAVDDPKEAGRIRVRALPMFKDTETIPIDDLPWAVPADSLMLGANGAGAAAQDIGARFIPTVGSWVFTFFEAGNVYHPVYFAAAPAYQNDTPDGPILTRKADPTIAARTAALSTGVIPAAVIEGEPVWIEPAPAHAAVYPKNRVIKTESGITIELDDTDGVERVMMLHPSGTNFEIRPDGSMTIHVKNDLIEVIEGDHFVHVKGDRTVTVDGSDQLHVGVNRFTTILGNRRELVTLQDTLAVLLSRMEIIGANHQITVGGLQNILVAGAQFIQAIGVQVINAGAAQTINAVGLQVIQSPIGTTLINPTVPVVVAAVPLTPPVFPPPDTGIPGA